METEYKGRQIVIAYRQTTKQVGITQKINEYVTLMIDGKKVQADMEGRDVDGALVYAKHLIDEGQY